MKIITRTVWLLSLVSLFTDVSSEMLYPIMPVYLLSIHFSVAYIGILEGLAEATAGLSKGFFGKASDSLGKRLPFVQLGYSLSAISKPLLALFTWPIWIFSARTLDRLGKGIRTGARDAMLSAEATPETKGRVFGFHRSMDTMGAVLGPLSSLIYLYFFPGNYKTLFIIAFAPGVIAILFTFITKEKTVETKPSNTNFRFWGFLGYWKESSSAYQKVVGGMLLFALVNSSDMFLLLRLKDSGCNDTVVIGLYIFYNLIYALGSYPLGYLGDKLGLKRTYTFGLLLFAIVYMGMGMTSNLYISIGLFVIYGLYAAATDGISKAWISNICDKKDIATALGSFAGYQSICALLASSITGIMWKFGGSKIPFLFTGTITLLLFIYFGLMASPPKAREEGH